MVSEMFLSNFDNEIKVELLESGKYSDNFWNFKGKSKAKNNNVFFNYPAMMVPAMQAKLIDIILNFQTNVKSVLDPFVGSGTTMIESMMKGLNFSGQDINPLAILLCNSKKIPFYQKKMKEKIEILLENIKNDSKLTIDIDFPNRDKWFKKEVSISLSTIRRNILLEKSKWARQFFWVALAETIRLSSNSRTSTFKLHIKKSDIIENSTFDVFNKFKNILNNNFELWKLYKENLNSKKLLLKSTYKKEVNIFLENSSEEIKLNRDEKFDLLISSPPYGDNHTTVTYGQFSYLPLQWIELDDIHPKISPELLKTINYIDSHSLGGRKFNDTVIERKLESASPTLLKILNKIENTDCNKKNKILSFYADLSKCLEKCIVSLKQNAYMIWTVGNRTVAGIIIPLDVILREIIEDLGGKYVLSLNRDIINKRMAIRNKDSKTMTHEIVIIMRKE
jgi:DNA modification methylase